MMLDAYDDASSWRFSSQIIELLWKLTLKPVLSSDCSVDDFEGMLSFIERTDFRRLLQHWVYRSKQGGESDKSDRGTCVDWFYYDPYARRAINESELKTLSNAPRPVRPANYPTGLNHSFPPHSWEEDEESD